MIRPGPEDVSAVGVQVGRVVTAVGVLMLVPAGVAAAGGHPDVATAYVIGASVAVLAGTPARRVLHHRRRLTWSQALVTVAAAWLAAAAVGALPLALSAHYAGYGDALVEAMSGLTATGLTLVQDLDHLPAAHSLWRHLLHVLGGQATIVVALTLFTAAGLPAGTLTVGESRDERVLANVRRTTRLTLRVGAGLAAVGVPALAVAGLWAGLEPLRAAWHALTLFASAANTGGFALTSASVGLLHSPAVELVVMVLMLAGATSIALHAAMGRTRLRELARNLEVRVLGASLLVLTAGVLVGLGRAGTFTDLVPLYRQGVFTLISAHATSGLHVADPRLLATDWGGVAPAMLVAAMAVGGMAASTAGGITTWRLGVTVRGVMRDVRAVLLPESTYLVTGYHHGRHRVLSDGQVRAAASLLLLQLATFLGGALVILAFVGDVALTEALFESTAATTTTGLSLDVLSPVAPPAVKGLAFVQMWLGRLQYVAVFALAGLVVSMLVSRR